MRAGGRLAIHLEISQRDEGAAEAEESGHHEQPLEIQPRALRQHAVDAEQLHGDAQHGENREVRDDEQEDALHVVFPSGGGVRLLDGDAQHQFNATNGDGNH